MKRDCFYVSVRIRHRTMNKSPLNYTGGKYKLLPQILPLFPQKIDTFVDLFCGGCNVGANIDAEKIIYNDQDRHLLDLYSTFKNLGKEQTFDFINQIIEKYGLSLASKNGYDFYGCESANGLGNYNKEKYLKLRTDFNNETKHTDYYNLMFYVLIVYAFNNQIRFNSKGDYNLPVGKRDFNQNMVEKLSNFIDVIKKQNCIFNENDFRQFDTSGLGNNDFVYLDPPYLITCATYNEQNGWTEDSERDLLSFIDKLHEQNIKFALSNVLRSKGKENKILIDWLNKNSHRYKLIKLKFDYSNSNYQTKDKNSTSEEVLVVNY